ncbi:hypothetical protein Ddye_024437 [Dipteronia dyeriana]|uniref:Zinc knuckle CX2CX4HX4C domain-containing protein n=1 Tax=Dipteronia dyeriana TaxID=168575 RepID=A0AAD9WSZ0_9ROSI|nr:hypothetical protein Ddye_024437 [Dipteronia dyeriana]
MTAKIGRFLGNMIGEVKKIDIGKFGDYVGKYIRVRVMINVLVPLRRILRVDVIGDGKETAMLLRYERLPELYFECGRWGHVVRKCLEGDEYDVNTNYDSLNRVWLRASSPSKSGQFRSRRDNIEEEGQIMTLGMLA